MAGNTYYQDELRYLRDVGPEFARANPEIARVLGDPGADPDVERLLEGVAFLCGRIREKLDDELPELTASMMDLLWPHYLRPIPSMAVVELNPDIDAMQAPLPLEAGAEFASTPVDGTTCRFRSCWSLKLRPWQMEQVRLESESARPVRLVLQLRTSEKVTLDALELDSVRFHLAGDTLTAFTLYLLLSAHVEEVSVSNGMTGPNRREMNISPGHVAPAGLDRGEGVLPYPRRSFVGYRLLQEYFAFKDRFLFVDFRELDHAVTQLELTDTLEVAITFNRRLETYPLVSRDNVRLHCVPVINLFEHAADPIRLHHDRSQHLVQPARSGSTDRRHLEVYSVEEVTGLVRTDTLESRKYHPFYSFEHSSTDDPRQAIYYQTRIRPNVIDGDLRRGTDTYISFVSPAGAGEFPAEETISIELLCTNRDLPNALRAGDICQPTDTSPAGVRFRNLTKPTAAIPPPLGKRLHWRLISHMSLNYVSLSNVEHFRELLRVYGFQSEFDARQSMAHQRLLDGILRIQTDHEDRLIQGSAVRGSTIQVELNEEHFNGEGDAYLFSSILDRFTGLYATVNAYTQLTVRFARNGQIYKFPVRWGEQLTPAGMRAGA